MLRVLVGKTYFVADLYFATAFSVIKFWKKLLIPRPSAARRIHRPCDKMGGGTAL